MLPFLVLKMSKVKHVLSFLLIILSVLIFTKCANVPQMVNEINELIKEYEKKYNLDSRIAIWCIDLKFISNSLMLTGETDHKGILDTLVKTIGKKYPNLQIVNKVNVLPDSSIGKNYYGLVNVSVASIVSDPKHPAELKTQIILGHRVLILKESGDFYLVKGDDNYIGWILKDCIVRGDKKFIDRWFRNNLYVFYDLEGRIYESADYSSNPISDIVMGGIVKFIGKREDWIFIELPDRRRGFIPRYQLISYDKYKSLTPSSSRVVRLARRMLGRPYLWGGTSTKFVDCSGLIQFIFRNLGMLLPRDADMQSKLGEPVDTSGGFSNLKPGDLLFFGNQSGEIDHVALYIGNLEYIHASGMVRINSLDEESENFDRKRKESLKFVKRLTID